MVNSFPLLPPARTVSTCRCRSLAGACGDLVLYSRYVTVDGDLVLGVPELVVSHEPDAALVAIEIIGEDDLLTAVAGGFIAPALVAVYSDGTRLRRALTRADFSVTSNIPRHRRCFRPPPFGRCPAPAVPR